MISYQPAPEDEVCPVDDTLLGELYNASKLDLPVVAAALAPAVMAPLALFCYRRSHLYKLGLAIAACCDKQDLVRSGASVGATLFERSRQELPPTPALSHYATRRKITLAETALEEITSFNEEPCDEINEAVTVVPCSSRPGED